MIGQIGINNKIKNNNELVTYKVKSGDQIKAGEFVEFSDSTNTYVTNVIKKGNIIGIAKTPGNSEGNIPIYLIPKLIEVDLNLHKNESGSSYNVGFTEMTNSKNIYTYTYYSTSTSSSYYAIARLKINNKTEEKKTLRLMELTTSTTSYNFLYFMNLDIAATESSSAESSYKNGGGVNQNSEYRYVDYEIPANSEHFIDIKYRKSSSTSTTIKWSYEIF